MSDPTSRQPPLGEWLLCGGAATAWVLLVRPGPLSLPYFWDEADVYVQGARWLSEHNFNITPGVFDDDYSRGHPQLFYLIVALAFGLWSSAPAVGHATVLPFTIAALMGTYALGRELGGRGVGCASALALAMTPLFMSIGNMVLPEVPLTALTVWALVAFARGHLRTAIALAIVSVWFKETGIFTGAAIGLAVLWQHRSSLTSRRARCDIAWSLLPLVALLAFFGWQKVAAGYYIFPHHGNLFVERPFDLESVLSPWPSMLLTHGRGWLTSGVVVALVIAWTLRSRLPNLAPGGSSVWVACLALPILTSIFFSKMFWLERYALPAHPAFLTIAAFLVFDRASTCYRVLGWRMPLMAAVGLWAVALSVGAAGFWSIAPENAEEQTFAYAHVVESHRAAFDLLGSDDEPVITVWPLTVELRYPHFGFVDAPRSASHVRDLPDEAAVGAVIVPDASPHAERLRELARERGLVQIGIVDRPLAPHLEVFAFRAVHDE